MNEETKLEDVYTILLSLKSDPPRYDKYVEIMRECCPPDIVEAAVSLAFDRDNAPRSFSPTYNSMKEPFKFMEDPDYRASIQGNDYSLRDLSNPNQPVKLYDMTPRHDLPMTRGLQRLRMSAAILYKEQSPGSGRIIYELDELPQLGYYPEISSLMNIGRGSGNQARLWTQSRALMRANFDADTEESFEENAAVRQTLGPRSKRNAEELSASLGTHTITVDSPFPQRSAELQQFHAARRLLSGGDPMQAAFEAMHHEGTASQQVKKARELAKVSELLNLPMNKQIIEVDGCFPILADLDFYFEQQDMAGKYLPVPNHPPMDQVRIQTRRGARWAKVITKKRPPWKYRHFPQFQHGIYKFVKGFE